MLFLHVEHLLKYTHALIFIAWFLCNIYTNIIINK